MGTLKFFTERNPRIISSPVETLNSPAAYAKEAPLPTWDVTTGTHTLFFFFSEEIPTPTTQPVPPSKVQTRHSKYLLCSPKSLGYSRPRKGYGKASLTHVQSSFSSSRQSRQADHNPFPAGFRALGSLVNKLLGKGAPTPHEQIISFNYHSA